MFREFIMSAVLVSSLSVFAHEGHDNAPGTLKSKHGGVVTAGKEVNLEYVVSGTEVKLYPLGHDGKDIAANAVKVAATTKAPKGKPQNTKLEIKDGVYSTQIDFKGAYRSEMTVNIDDRGKISVFKFQVEK